jgi:transcriptional regulator with XRE-family HTH domain
VRTVPTPREQLAETLKDARVKAGYTSHGALAKKLLVSRPVVTKAENPAHPVPSDALLAAWAGATGVGLDTLTDLAQRAKSGTPDFFMPYKTAEAQADTLRCWNPTLVPGLCQCEAYARAVLSVEPYTPERLDELVAARMERQQVIGRAYLTVIIDQLVLQRPVGSAAIMAEQCAHLASVAERRPDIALHVLPEGANLGTWGELEIASKGTTVTVNMGAFEDVPTTAPELVGRAIQAFERILGAAMPRADSLDYVVSMEEQWKTRT